MVCNKYLLDERMKKVIFTHITAISVFCPHKSHELHRLLFAGHHFGDFLLSPHSKPSETNFYPPRKEQSFPLSSLISVVNPMWITKGQNRGNPLLFLFILSSFNRQQFPFT